MNTEVIKLIAEEVERHQRALADIAGLLAATPAPPAASDTNRLQPNLIGDADATPGRFRIASAAFKTLNLTDQQVRRLCRANLVDCGGFALKFKPNGSWYVREPDFSKWLERFERGECGV